MKDKELAANASRGATGPLPRIASEAEPSAAFTPGPWRLCTHLRSLADDAACGCGYRGGIWGGDEEHIVCEIGGSTTPGEEALDHPRYPRPVELANARLIAAAPDQHVAAREIDRWMLVIESAVRQDAPQHWRPILDALKANRAALTRALGTTDHG